METVQQIFSYISGLGNYLLIPVMIAIIGLFVRLKPIKSIRAGLTVGIGLVGLDLVLGLVWANISPVVNLLVEKFDLNLTTIDTGWGTAAGLAFSTTIGAFIIPFILLVNIIMLALRATKTMNIDVWNYWHYAFSGATVYLLTNNIIYGFIAATAHCVISLIIADRTAEMVQKEMGLPGISIPQGYAVSTVPVFMALEKLYNLVLPKKAEGSEKSTSSIENNAILSVLKEPIFLGMIIGSLLGFAVGYDVPASLKLGVYMAALLFILPRMIKILMEGLLPISDQTRAFMSKKYAGQQFYIGLDSAVLLGHPTTVAVGLLLIPITLVLSMIIPWNGTLPLGDLAATAFFVSMASVIHKGKFWRTLVSGTVMMVIVLSVATFFAPQLTSFAGSGSITIPEGATQITALSAGNLIALILYGLSSLGIFGVAVVVAGIGGLIYSGRVYLSKKATLNTTEFTTANAKDYVNK
jgi:PTS system galactitol-specific IIC component